MGLIKSSLVGPWWERQPSVPVPHLLWITQLYYADSSRMRERKKPRDWKYLHHGPGSWEPVQTMKVKRTDYLALACKWGLHTCRVGPLIFNYESDNVDSVFTNSTHSSTQPHKGPVHHPSDWVIMEVITNCLSLSFIQNCLKCQAENFFLLFYGRNKFTLNNWSDDQNIVTTIRPLTASCWYPQHLL